MTNYEWLLQMGGEERQAWFDAEHVDANDVSTRKSDVRADCVCANDANVAQDNREKLEADARALQTRIWRAGANSDGVSLTHIIELLDRQAEITEHELCKQCDWPSLAAQPDYESQGRIVALTNKVDELTAERDALADDLLTCNRERESLRRTLGVAIDHAHDILQLIDEGMA